MAYVGGTGRTRSRSRIVEDFVPYSGWTEDAKGHYLLIDLPGNQSTYIYIYIYIYMILLVSTRYNFIYA
jgi:hypothetical protein